MAIYLLDTNTLTLLQRRHHRLLVNLARHIGDEVAVTSVNVEETLGGWFTLLRQAKTNADQAKAAARLANAVTNLTECRSFDLRLQFANVPCGPTDRFLLKDSTHFAPAGKFSFK